MIEGGSPGDSLCIIETTDLDSIEHGSREPMQPFESPFLGMTDDQVRAWLKAHRRPDFAFFAFAVLDEDTIKNKTCRICCTHDEALDAYRVLITDFYAIIRVQIPVEEGVMSWCDLELIGTGQVYGRKNMEDFERIRADRVMVI